MIQCYGGEYYGTEQERQFPCIVDIACLRVKDPCKGYEHALPEYGGQTVECASYAYEFGLGPGLESKHIESVCCYVMGSGCECRDPEYR